MMRGSELSRRPTSRCTRRSAAGRRRLPIALAALLILIAAASAGAVDWRPAESGDGGALVLPGGGVLHVTGRPVHGLRTIEATVDGLELALWEEEAAGGERRPHYAVIEDGRLRGRVRETGYRIELVDRSFDPLIETQPLSESALASRPGDRLALVQLWATALPALQERIAEAGGVVHRHLTRHALIVELDPGARAEVAALPFVRWIGPFHPEYRLEPVLRPAVAAAAAGGADSAAERYSILLLERGGAAQRGLGSAIEALGGEVEILTPQGFRMEATLTAGQLAELVHDGRVQYIDRWGGPGGTDMDQVREVGGADYIESVAGYTGQGVAGEIFDTELRVTHQEWGTAPLIHSTGTSGGAHGTSVTSNVFARGINASARGMLPDGQPIFFRYTESSQFGGPISRYTINQELLDPLGPYQALFQTASVGSDRTTQYTTISADTDDLLFVHQLLSTQSQSNAGNQDSRPQAWAKNMVSVGGLRHQATVDRSDDAWTGGASIGPAADGRIKPDLSFFYHLIFSASNGSDSSYTNFGGTSSATPQTAGHFGIFFQMWHEGLWSGHGGGATVFDSRPHMATAKALMIHNAHRYDWTQGGANGDLDRFKQGWGTADLRSLYDTAADTRIIDESVVLAPLGSHSRPVPIWLGDEQLRATLVYVDPMGVPGAGVHRINDLSLRLTSPTAVVYWGNNGLTAGNFSTPGGVSNEIDTVENVFIETPEAGTWTVEVLADEVVADSHTETPAIDADFALVVSVVREGTIFADGFESGDTTAWSGSTP
jgi:subtilisin family serine protease